MARDRSEAPRRVDQPEPGLFKMRLVARGPFVAAEIHRQDDGRWCATINGAVAEAHLDPAQAEGVFRVWHYGHRIDASEHAFLVERAAWARIHDPDSPEANPERPINIGALPPAF